jgi:hypothetical protein
MNDVTSNGLLRKPFGDVQCDSSTGNAAAALLPISILSDIVSLGTALAFSIVGNAIPAFLLGGYGRRHSKLRGARP